MICIGSDYLYLSGVGFEKGQLNVFLINVLLYFLCGTPSFYKFTLTLVFYCCIAFGYIAIVLFATLGVICWACGLSCSQEVLWGRSHHAGGGGRAAGRHSHRAQCHRLQVGCIGTPNPQRPSPTRSHTHLSTAGTRASRTWPRRARGWERDRILSPLQSPQPSDWIGLLMQ